MIARYRNPLFYQNIKWECVAKYIDKLKSRKYKTFIQKFHIYNFQNDLVNFPLLILSSYKSYIRDINNQLNSFELGYTLYCFSSIRYLDTSFFYYYRNSSALTLFNFFKYLVVRNHYLLIFLSFQAYGNYLNYICNTFYGSFYNVDNSFYKQYIQLQKYESLLILELKSLINFASLSIFFNKIYFDKDLVKHILNFFDVSTFSRLLTNLNIKNNFLFLEKNKLFRKLQEVVMLQLTYEISSILYRVYNFQYIQFKVVFVDKKDEVLLLYNTASIERIAYLLFGSGFLIKMVKNFREVSLVKGLFTRSFFYSIENWVYPFYFIVQPSLYSQFIFIKKVSLIIHKINRQSLFVINIRLNMLFVLWLSQYKRLNKKVIYLLDYLIDLKLRYYYINYSYFDIKLFQRSSFSRIIVRKRIYFYSNIYSRSYKKCYGLFKLLWGLDFKCYMNLREAI